MSWCCPLHHAPLERVGPDWRCPTCGELYPECGGVASFAPAADELAVPGALAPLFATPTAETVQRLSREWECRHEPFEVDWKLLLPLPAEGARIALIGETLGDDALALAERSEVVALLPSSPQAEMLLRRAAATGGPGAEGNLRAAVLCDPASLPLADASMDAICLEEHLAPAYDLGWRNADAVAREWRRVLRPEGTVFVGRSSSWPGLARVAAGLSARRSRDLEVAVAERLIGSRTPTDRPALQALERELRRQGFDRVRRYAPLPDSQRIQVVVPLDDSAVVAYFLRNLVRRNSFVLRAVLAGVGLANRVGALRFLVPYTYSFLQRSSPDGETVERHP